MTTETDTERTVAERVLEVFLTDSTCGESCWSAAEDVCRCSCAGKNHGLTRQHGATRPARTAKIKGYVYQLISIGSYHDTEKQARTLVQQIIRDELVPVRKYGGFSGLAGFPEDAGYPVKTRVASESEENRWPELAPFRDREHRWVNRPHLLWVRVDLVEQLKTPTSAPAHADG